MKKLIPILAMLTLAIVLLAPRLSRAQHEATGQGNAEQNIAPQPDFTLIAGASPTVVLQLNRNRVTSHCRIIGAPGVNTMRLGDSSIGPSRGRALDATVPATTLDVTGAIYAYSSTGVVGNCDETVRGAPPATQTATPTATPTA